MYRPFYRNKFSSDTLLQKDILFEDAQRSALTDLAAIGGLAGGMTLGSALSEGSVGGTALGGLLGLAAPLVVSEYMKRKALERAIQNDHELRIQALQQPMNPIRHVKSVGAGLAAGSLAGSLTSLVAPPLAPVAFATAYTTTKPLANNIMIERKLKEME